MKFSIRDLFLVTVIVALAAGWWVDRSRLAVEFTRLKEDMALYGSDANIRSDNLSPEVLKRIPRRKLPNSSAPAPNPPNP
jgi:hypothetical protein